MSNVQTNTNRFPFPFSGDIVAYSAKVRKMLEIISADMKRILKGSLLDHHWTLFTKIV